MDTNLKDNKLDSIGTAVLSLDKKFLDADDRFCEILGYSQDELLEISWKKRNLPVSDLYRKTGSTNFP